MTSPHPAAVARLAAEALTAAADDIDARGLAQGQTQDQLGRRCALTAITYAVAAVIPAGQHRGLGVPVALTCYRALGEAVKQQWPTGWNDEPGRTAAQVSAALRDAAELVTPDVAPTQTPHAGRAGEGKHLPGRSHDMGGGAAAADDPA